MMECTLHNLLTSCQYPQVFWIYQMNDYDENILLTKGTKQEMLEDDENSFDLIDHINDVVEYWTIREDGAMFVRIRMDDRAKELFSEDYVKKWDRFNPLKRPYLYTAELDDFTNCIYGSSEYLHPYGDPLDCHHFDNDDRKTEPTISKMEQVDKDINVRSKDEPQTELVNDSPILAKDLVDDEFNPYDEECMRCKHLKLKCEFIPTYCKFESRDEPQTNMAVGKRSDATADKYNLYGKTTTDEPQTDCAWK